MAQYGTLITNIGLAQIANAQVTQSKVGLEYIALGDGNGAHYVPTQNQTALVNEVWRGPIAELSIDPTNDNRIIVDAVIPVTAGGFTIREIGIFDDKNQLIAVGQYPEKYKPELSEGVSEETIIHFVIETNNADVVKLTVDPTVIIASRKYVDEKLATHTDPTKNNAHKIKNIEGLEDELSGIKNMIGDGSSSGNIIARLNKLESEVGNLANLETTQKANLVAAINEVRQNLLTHLNDTSKHLYVKGYFNGDIDTLKANELYLVTTGSINTPTPGNGNLVIFETGTGAVTQWYNPLSSNVLYFRSFDGNVWTQWDISGANTGYEKPLTGSVLNWALSQPRDASVPVRSSYYPSDLPVHEEGFLEVKVGASGYRNVYFTTWREALNNTIYIRPLAGTFWTIGWSRLLNDNDYDQLFTSVSNGKYAVANAITQKGIYTVPNAEFATMAANISQINTGRREARGQAVLSNVGGEGRIAAWGLAFRPAIILIARQGGVAWHNHAIFADGATFAPAASGINVYTYIAGQYRATNGESVVFFGNGFEMRITADYNSSGAAGTYSWIALE